MIVSPEEHRRSFPGLCFSLTSFDCLSPVAVIASSYAINQQQYVDTQLLISLSRKWPNHFTSTTDLNNFTDYWCLVYLALQYDMTLNPVLSLYDSTSKLITSSKPFHHLRSCASDSAFVDIVHVHKFLRLTYYEDDGIGLYFICNWYRLRFPWGSTTVEYWLTQNHGVQYPVSCKWVSECVGFNGPLDIF